MKTLVENATVTLHNHTYKVDVLLGLYASSLRPSIVLMEKLEEKEFAYQPEIIAVASTNPPPGFLIGFTSDCFVVKNYSENEGLWEQLASLEDSSGARVFTQVFNRQGNPVKITLGFTTCEVWALTSTSKKLFEDLLEETHSSKTGNFRIPVKEQ